MNSHLEAGLELKILNVNFYDIGRLEFGLRYRHQC